MSVTTVSSQAALLSALKTAQSGDTIQLEAGNYGSVVLDGSRVATKYLKFPGEVTITSASGTDKAVIESLTLNAVSHITLDNINFDSNNITQSSVPFAVKSSDDVTIRNSVFTGELDANGYGEGTGLKISQGSDIVLENSEIKDFRSGVEAWATAGLTLQGNDMTRIAYDGILSGHVQGLTIQNNTIAMNPDPNADIHRDIIQIYNEGTRAVSSDILIADNTLTSPDAVTHGIYMGNADAKSTGNLSEFFSNVVIRDNVILTGQKYGIAIGQTNGLAITGNTIIQNDAMHDNASSSTIPLVHVVQGALGVTITDNILNGAPVVTNSNFVAVTGGGSGWTVADNKVVGLDWAIGDDSTDPWANVQGNGKAEYTKFDGAVLHGGDHLDTCPDLSFDEGDVIVFNNYDAGTFKQVWGGNKLNVTTDGIYAKLDSLVDVQELVHASAAVTATVSNDTLTLSIEQAGGTHTIVLDGLGQEYQSTYDPLLF